MADEANKSGSWWSTLPGILTAIAAVITAATGLVAILSQTGMFGEKSKAFVGQKASDVRDAISPPSPSPGAKVDVKSSSTTSAGARDGAVTGIAAAPLHAAPFTGAILTLRNGSVVKLRDDIREYCVGRPLLKTLDGQSIEMQRIRRFELSDWNVSKGNGDAHVTLNNGEAIDVKIGGCAMFGNNDLGDYRGAFENIRSVEFVR